MISKISATLILLLALASSSISHSKPYTAVHLPKPEIKAVEGQIYAFYDIHQFQQLIWMDQELSRLTNLTLKLEELSTAQTKALTLRSTQQKIAQDDRDLIILSIESIKEQHKRELQALKTKSLKKRVKSGSIGAAVGFSLAIVLYTFMR